MSSCAESASMSASGTSKRVRTQRVLTNVSALGEIHSVDVDGALSFCDDVDSIFMTDGAQYISMVERVGWVNVGSLARLHLV